MTHTLHQTPKSTLAIALLWIGGAIFLISSLFFLHTRTAIDDLQSQQKKHKLSSKDSAVKVELSAQQRAELSAVNVAIRDIARPWPDLFKALEKAHSEAVGLLSVKPNLNNKTVHIVAVAFSVDSMLAYISKLSQQKNTAFVSLVSTEGLTVDGQNAMQFELLLNWKLGGA